MNVSATQHRMIGAILVVFISLLLGYSYVNDGLKRARDAEAMVRREQLLDQSLRDSLHVERTANGELRVSKRTIVATLEDLERRNDELTTSQRALLDRVKATQTPTRHVIAAATITQLVEVGPTNLHTTTDSAHARVIAELVSDSLQVGVSITGVRPAGDSVPQVVLEHVRIPGELKIEFVDDPTQPGRPVAFSVHATNPLLRAQNLESYAIPQVNIPPPAPEWPLGKKLKLGFGAALLGLLTGLALSR